MRGNKVQKSGGTGKSILAFFLGMLFGIIFLVGSLAGAIGFVLYADVDTVLDIFNVDNSADENGDNKYINTNEDKDGVSNILELVTRITAMAGNFRELTLGQIDALVPATHGLVDKLLESLSKYVEVDYDTLSQQKFSELSDYIREVVMNIRPGQLIAGLELGGDGAANQLIDLILCGIEAKYVTVGESDIPVYYDCFTQNGRYVRGDGEYLPEELEEYIVAEKDEVTYRVYHYMYNGVSYVAEKIDNGYEATDVEYALDYSEEYTKCSGNYYYEAGSDERIYVDPITLGSFVDGDGMGALESLPLYELFGTMSSDDEANQRLLTAMLGELTVGDLMNGTADFHGTIQNVYIGDIIEANGNKLLEKLGQYTIGGLSEAMDNLEVADLIDVEADGASVIMLYLAFGVTKVEKDEVTQLYTAEKDGQTVYFRTSMNSQGVECLDSIYSEADLEEEHRVEAVRLPEVGTRLSNLQNDVKVGDIMGITDDDSTILKAIRHSTINSLPEDINNLTINELYADSIYTDPVFKEVVAENPEEGQIAFNCIYLYYQLVDGEYILVNSDDSDPDNNGKLDTLPSTGIYYTYGEVKGFWQLLIMANDDSGEKSEKAYTLSRMADMADNLAYNLKTCSLRDLYNADVIEIEDEENSPLNKVIPEAVSQKYGNRTLGSLTISEAVDFVGEFLTAI